jgi:hypothetical protein
MHAPPDPEMRSPAIRPDDRANSQKIVQCNHNLSPPAAVEQATASPLVSLQALRPSRLCAPAHCTAYIVASLAYGVAQ